MLVIRLQRRGRTGLAMYRIVVQDKRTHPSKEKVVARLGSYNPHTKDAKIEVELAQKYLDNGAQPSPRLVKLLKDAGVKLPSWVKETPKKESSIRNPEKLRKNQPKEETIVEEPSNDESSENKEDEAEEVAAEASSEE